jgi:hypothetical protein
MCSQSRLSQAPAPRAAPGSLRPVQAMQQASAAASLRCASARLCSSRSAARLPLLAASQRLQSGGGPAAAGAEVASIALFCDATLDPATELAAVSPADDSPDTSGNASSPPSGAALSQPQSSQLERAQKCSSVERSPFSAASFFVFALGPLAFVSGSGCAPYPSVPPLPLPPPPMRPRPARPRPPLPAAPSSLKPCASGPRSMAFLRPPISLAVEACSDETSAS